MPLATVKLLSATKAATLDSTLAAYKTGAGAGLLTAQRAMAADMILDAGGNVRMYLALAHGGLDVPVTKTADLQHVTVQVDGALSALQAAIDADLAHVVHATNTSGNTTVAGQVTVSSTTFFAGEDVGRLMTVNDVEKLITGIGDNSVAAEGTLTTVLGRLITDGDNFIVDDGVNPPVTFEFDDDASVTETDTLRAIAYDSGVHALGSITTLDKSALSDGDVFALGDGTNPAVSFYFVKTAALAAAGSLTAVAKAAPLTDGDNFTLNDGVNPATVFEFQVTGGFVPVPGRVAIDIQALATAIDIANAMRTAITGATLLAITPDAPGAALINLINDAVGTAGNVTITESIFAGPGVTLTPVGMLGGTNEWAPGGGWGATKVKVSIITDTTAIQVAARTRTAITGATLDITPDAPGAALINLTNDAAGTAGNVAITQTLASGTLTPVGMLGGTDGSTANALRDTIVTAFDNAPTLDITAIAGGAATVDLVNDLGGVVGNNAIVDNVTPAGFVIAGMSGGVDATTSAALYTGTALASGTGKTVKLLGAEVVQGLYLSTILDRDRDTNMLLLVACEGQLP
jgi:hypothetical protein